MKRKQGRVTERSPTVREEKKGKEENSFHRKCLCFLTCLLMGDTNGSPNHAATHEMYEDAAMPYEPEHASAYSGQSQVERVKERHEQKLMAIGRAKPAIVVYLR